MGVMQQAERSFNAPWRIRHGADIHEERKSPLLLMKPASAAVLDTMNERDVVAHIRFAHKKGWL